MCKGHADVVQVVAVEMLGLAARCMPGRSADQRAHKLWQTQVPSCYRCACAGEEDVEDLLALYEMKKNAPRVRCPCLCGGFGRWLWSQCASDTGQRWWPHLEVQRCIWWKLCWQSCGVHSTVCFTCHCIATPSFDQGRLDLSNREECVTRFLIKAHSGIIYMVNTDVVAEGK